MQGKGYPGSVCASETEPRRPIRRASVLRPDLRIDRNAPCPRRVALLQVGRCGIPSLPHPLMARSERARRTAASQDGAGGLPAHFMWRLPPDQAGFQPSWVVPEHPRGRAFHVSTDEPMMASMAGRYAAALFELAKEKRQLAQVEHDVVNVPGHAGRERGPAPAGAQPGDLRRGPGHGAWRPCSRRPAISGLTANFLKLIARNRRLFAVADMLKSFRALLARERGEVSADVASAHPLSAEQMNALKDTLKRRRSARMCRSTRASIPTCSAASSSRSAAG